MTDDKSKRGAADRRTVAGSEAYEVAYFAGKHAITADQARELIASIGNDREKLDEAARSLTQGQA